MESKGLLLGCGTAGCLTVTVVAALGCYFAFPFILLNFTGASGLVSLNMAGLERPAALEKPGVRLGKDMLNQHTFAEIPDTVPVTSIREADFLGDGSPEVGIAFRTGAIFVNHDGDVKRRVRFSSEADHVDIIPGWSGARYAFLNRGSWAVSPSLISAKGKEIWRYPSRMGVDDMAAGDLNADGTPELVVGLNGDGGIRRLSVEGNSIWRRSGGNIWHVEIVDTTGEDSWRIVHSDASGMMTVRDAEGSIISRFNPGDYVSFFSPVRWPGIESRDVAVFAGPGQIRVVDFSGNKIARLKAPACSGHGDARAVTVRFGGKLGTCFAVLVDTYIWDRAALYVYRESGELAYFQVFGTSCASIGVCQNEETDRDRLLVGATGQVIAYSPGQR